MKLNVIMPMGGGGTRFGNHGFNVPKPLIEIYGKPFFYWATQSLVKNIEIESLTFVVLKEHIEKFAIDQSDSRSITWSCTDLQGGCDQYRE